MYLADELSAEDRAEVERSLAADERLRAELDSLRAGQEAVAAALAALDRATPPVNEAAAVHRVGRMMRQWAAQPRPDDARQAADGRRLPRWALPVTGAAAAAAVVFALVWYTGRNTPGGPIPSNPENQQIVEVPSPEEPPAIVEVPAPPIPPDSPVVPFGDDLQRHAIESLASGDEGDLFTPGSELMVAGGDEIVFDVPLGLLE